MTNERKLELFDNLCQFIFNALSGVPDDVLARGFEEIGFTNEEVMEICERREN